MARPTVKDLARIIDKGAAEDRMNDYDDTGRYTSAAMDAAKVMLATYDIQKRVCGSRRDAMLDLLAHLTAAHYVLTKSKDARDQYPSNKMFDIAMSDIEASLERGRALLQTPEEK